MNDTQNKSVYVIEISDARPQLFLNAFPNVIKKNLSASIAVDRLIHDLLLEIHQVFVVDVILQELGQLLGGALQIVLVALEDVSLWKKNPH